MLADVVAAFDPQKEYYSVTWEYYPLLPAPHADVVQGRADRRRRHGARSRHRGRGRRRSRTTGSRGRITLKTGVHYGDPFTDVEVTAQDFIRALEREANPKANVGGYSFYYSVIEGFDDFAAGKADSISGLSAPDDQHAR